jgi:hypothetical protein
MREPHAFHRTGDVGDHPCSRRLVERVEQLLVGCAGELRQRVEVKLAAEHRREHEQPVALVVEVREPARDHVANRLRQRDSTLNGEQAHSLGDEERVTVGLLVQLGRELGRRKVGCRQRDVLRNGPWTEAGEMQPCRHGLASRLGQ